MERGEVDGFVMQSEIGEQDVVDAEGDGGRDHREGTNHLPRVFGSVAALDRPPTEPGRSDGHCSQKQKSGDARHAALGVKREIESRGTERDENGDDVDLSQNPVEVRATPQQGAEELQETGAQADHPGRGVDGEGGAPSGLFGEVEAFLGESGVPSRPNERPAVGDDQAGQVDEPHPEEKHSQTNRHVPTLPKRGAAVVRFLSVPRKKLVAGSVDQFKPGQTPVHRKVAVEFDLRANLDFR